MQQTNSRKAQEELTFKPQINDFNKVKSSLMTKKSLLEGNMKAVD